jgi:hypothetical protein
VRTTAAQLTADASNRRIEGLVAPFGEIGYATVDGEPRELLFESGGLVWDDPSTVTLVVDHTEGRHTFAGRAATLDDIDAGVWGTFGIPNTTAGNDALIEASEAFRAGLSVEADLPEPIPPTGVITVTAANPGKLRRVALVETPAFATAKVHKAAAAQVQAAPAPNAPTQPATAAEVPNEDLGKAVTALTEVVTTLTTAMQNQTPPDPAAPPAAAPPAAASHTPPAPARNPAIHAGGTPTVIAAHKLPTPGEYMHAVCLAGIQRDTTQLDRMRAEIAKVEASQAWAADQKIADTAGLVPTPIIGEVVKNIDASRPVVSSMRQNVLPAAGSSFKRPRITQHASVGQQSAEMDALSSQKMTVAGDSVSKLTFGGYVQLSEQEVDWTDPAALQLLIEDLADEYAIATDNYAADQLVAGATGSTQAAALDSTADLFVTGIATAAATSYAASGALPDTLYLAPDAWASLLSLDDADKRPVFPFAGPTNAIGQGQGVTSFNGNPLGLNLVVDANFAAATAIVGPSKKYEFFEQNKGLAQIEAPSTLGLVVAYRGYVAKYLAAPLAFIPLDITV